MDPLSIFIFIILFALSAFFSGSETALMSTPHHKIDSFIKQRKAGAKALKKIRSNADRLLIILLVGNNLVNITTASLATKISIDLAKAAGLQEGLIIGISTGIITILLLLFGELLPKTLAARYSDTIALAVSRVYLVLGKILYPLVIGVEFIVKLFQKKSQHKHTITDEEIESFIEMGNTAGVFEKGEYEKIKNMLDFYEVTAQEIMTPRINVDALSDTMTVKKAKEKLVGFSHSRIPVYHETIDNIDHIVRLKELLLAEEKGLADVKLRDLKLSDIIKVPITKPIHLILDQFKKTRSHVALVIDEYGGVAGLVTLEDIVEEVFGDIMDETDKETDAIKLEGGSPLFKSHITMDDFLDHMGLSFYELDISEEEFSGETLSYFITSHLERFPKMGEDIVFPLRTEEDLSKRNLNLRIFSLKKNVIGEIKAEIVQVQK